MTDSAEIALAEYLRRQKWLRSQVAAFKLTLDQAEERLRPWLAIALFAGADPAALGPNVAGAVADYRRAKLTDREACLAIATDLLPKAGTLAALASARDAAIDEFEACSTAAKAAQARALTALAINLYAPPYLPLAERAAGATERHAA